MPFLQLRALFQRGATVVLNRRNVAECVIELGAGLNSKCGVNGDA